MLAFSGAGKVGTAITRHLLRENHRVTLSFSHDQNQLWETAEALGASFGSVAEAAKYGDVVVLAAPWIAVPDVLEQAGPLERKIIWDCTNPLRRDLRSLVLGTTTSAGEEIARPRPRAKVVRAIPAFAEMLHSPSRSKDQQNPHHLCVR